MRLTRGDDRRWPNAGHFIAYDISSDYERMRTAVHLQKFAWRVQYSVFWAPPSTEPSAVLENLPKTSGGGDSTLLLPFCGGCRSFSLGAPYESVDAATWEPA